MINSFADKKTESIFNRKRVTGMSDALQRTARRKLLLIDAAEDIEDLRVPPGNRLEKLKGDRKGQYSIRINEQFRICFAWKGNNACDVEIVDYH